MVKQGMGVFVEKKYQEELEQLREAIRINVKEKKFKELEKLVHRYMLMVRPEAMRPSG